MYPSVWHELGPWMHAHSIEKSDGITNVTVQRLVNGNPLAEPILRNVSEVRVMNSAMYIFLMTKVGYAIALLWSTFKS